MKGMDILCTSQAATAITTDEPSPSSSSSSSISSTTHLTSGRAIDRHNPIIHDEKRVGKSFIVPPYSNPQHPMSPKPHNHHYKSITSGNSKTKKVSSGNKSKTSEQKRKLVQGGWGCTKPSAFISPPSSSRYLLSDKALLNVLNDFDPILTLVQKENSKALQAVKRDESFSASASAATSASSSASKLPPPSSSHSPDQVSFFLSLLALSTICNANPINFSVLPSMLTWINKSGDRMLLLDGDTDSPYYGYIHSHMHTLRLLIII